MFVRIREKGNFSLVNSWRIRDSGCMQTEKETIPIKVSSYKATYKIEAAYALKGITEGVGSSPLSDPSISGLGGRSFVNGENLGCKKASRRWARESVRTIRSGR